MYQTIGINSNESVKIKDESVGAILIDIKAQTAVDAVAAIQDLNKIDLEISVYRNGKLTDKFCQDYLDYILRALSGGSSRYAVAINPTSDGYLFMIPFDGCIKVSGSDYIEVKCKVQATAFLSLSTAKSEITIESAPAMTSNNVVSYVDSLAYTSNEQKINKPLGSNIVKVVLVHDLAADYDASTEAKPKNGINLTALGYENNASENLLVSTNRMMLQYEPNADFKDLVLYNNGSKSLQNVKLKAQYDKGVLADARIMMLKRKRF